MFEFNTDIEFDELFGQSFEPESPKRTFENDALSNVINKKPCFRNTSTTQRRSPTFLRNTLESPSKKICILDRDTPCNLQSKSESSINPQIRSLLVSPLEKGASRKFPGPAGLLPEHKDLNIRVLEASNNKVVKHAEMDMCSQLPVRAFQEGPWQQMRKDLSSDLSRVMFLPDKYNIAWIKAKMKNNQLLNQKAPFLAAVIQKIECLKLKTPVVTMVLKDATGQINATIIHDLYEEYINVLKAGSVIILKQFGVLTTDHRCNCYLTITTNNLVSVYSEKISNNNPEQSSFNNKIDITVVQDFSTEYFLKDIAEIKARHRADMLEQKCGVHLNWTSMSEGSSTHSRITTEIHNDECGSVGRNANYANNNFRSSTNLSSNSPIVTSSHNSTSVNLNKENYVDVLNTSVNKQRFNFKGLTSKSPPSLVLTSRISTTNSNADNCLNVKIPQTVSSNNHNTIKCSQISVSSDNPEHNAILQNLFEDVDADLLFEDF